MPLQMSVVASNLPVYCRCNLYLWRGQVCLCTSSQPMPFRLVACEEPDLSTRIYGYLAVVMHQNTEPRVQHRVWIVQVHIKGIQQKLEWRGMCGITLRFRMRNSDKIGQSCSVKSVEISCDLQIYTDPNHCDKQFHLL